MSKESRRRQRAASQTTNPTAGGKVNPTAGRSAPRQTAATAAATRPSSSAQQSNERAGRRERARYAAQPPFLERYRGAIIGVAVVVGVALIGAFVFVSATQPAYACTVEWQPETTPTPADGASPQPGYVQPDMGNTHVGIGTKVTYTYCPPASGSHYNAAGAGPIQPRLFAPGDTTVPEGWIHNLEHGGLVLLYNGDGPGATEEGQAALRDFYDDYPDSPVCGIQPGTTVGPVFARWDDMPWNYAALVWGRVLPLDTLDTAAILEFDQTYGERTNPEKLCPAPSAEPSGSAEPSQSAAPSESAAPSGSAAPSAS